MVRKGHVSKLNVGVERAKVEERVELTINLLQMVLNAW